MSNPESRFEERRTGQSMNYARARGIQNGDPERSGGPMAATVDRVMRRHHYYSETEGIRLVCKATDLDAAIRRAAESAAASLNRMFEDVLDANKILHKNWNERKAEKDSLTADVIERHVRQELGL